MLPILLAVSWTGKIDISTSLLAPENLVTRDGFGSPVPRQPAHLHTQAESGAYLRDSSRVPRRVHLFFWTTILHRVSPEFTYRWLSPPRVHLLRANKPRGSFKRVLPWQVTMVWIICACLSDTHYWCEVCIMLKASFSQYWVVLEFSP